MSTTPSLPAPIADALATGLVMYRQMSSGQWEVVADTGAQALTVAAAIEHSARLRELGVAVPADTVAALVAGRETRYADDWYCHVALRRPRAARAPEPAPAARRGTCARCGGPLSVLTDRTCGECD
jgi:hypothetical protein